MERSHHRSFPSRPRIIFMGTPQFAVPTLERMIREGYELVGVVTQPDRPKGRGRKLASPPVKRVAQEHNLTVFQPERLDNRFLQAIHPLQLDLLVVVAFGQIIPEAVLNAALWGGINIHASLLPRYRGSAPIQWAIINNEAATGITTMFMDEGLDTGPILLQEEVDIKEGETAGELHDRLAALAPDLLIRTLKGLAEGTVSPVVQDDSLATYTSRLTKEQGIIDWSLPGSRICGLIKGLDPWPGASTYYQGRALKLFGCLVGANSRKHETPGRVKGVTGKGLEIETGAGTVIVREFQLPGKTRMPAGDFIRGIRISQGSILGK
ncbi:MAG: methionyl-tRNA formyltransferase [Thermodesulfobacteriota bacterium]